MASESRSLQTWVPCIGSHKTVSLDLMVDGQNICNLCDNNINTNLALCILLWRKMPFCNETLVNMKQQGDYHLNTTKHDSMVVIPHKEKLLTKPYCHIALYFHTGRYWAHGNSHICSILWMLSVDSRKARKS